MMAERAKQTTAANFRAHCNTDKGKKEIRGFLDGLLKVREALDEQKKSWCWWLISGGKTPEEFKITVKSYDNPTICGLVWNRNFVAYRCRDCGISPCMSICADCFHAGNHEGHDFNMFKSQAGGACDCGDESVMSRSGFCSRHGKAPDETPERKPPQELFEMSRIVVPRLCMRLHLQLERVDRESLGANSDLMADANELAEFLMSICETDTMKNVVAECLMMKISEVETNGKERLNTASGQGTRLSLRSHSEPFRREESFDIVSSSENFEEDQNRTYLDFMMDFVTKLEFPQKLITFLLHLLPCKKYKECFTRVFCQNYQKIAKTLVSTTQGGPSVEQLANRVVHVSVQLYSNKHLAEKMVQEQNLLHVMVKVLHDMIKPALQPFHRGQLTSNQLVISCDNRALSEHCYWPIVSDFINILSHKSVAEVFLKDHDLIQQWIKFIQYLTGMNISQRKLLTHIEFEPTVYYTSFSVELEAASSPLWSLINACKILNSPAYVRNMITSIIDSLKNWYSNSSVIMPRRSEVTFHLPLLRYLSGFLSLAMSHFKMPLEELLPSHTLMAQMVEHLLQIQAAVCEIRAGRWVRNGGQIRSQVRLYAECHFCNSMIDLDIFLLQICAAFLDPDYLLDAILERFGINHWFKFGPLNVPTPPCFDSDTDISMVEGAFNLILNLLSSRLHLGLSHQEVIRQEMVALLCIGDRTHSQLVELIPDKPGQSHKIQEFEDALTEIADYRAPAFENGWMQQGKYAPKDKVWEESFDPVQVFHRAVQRQDIQSAMNRYSAFVNKTSQVKSSNLWPPFKSLRPLPKSCEGILRLLQCKTVHGMLYHIFHQAAQESGSISDSLLYTAVHLTSLALETPMLQPFKGLKPNLVQKLETEDVGCQIASRCIDHLEKYGKYVKGLHQVEDLHRINGELITTLQKDPGASIDSQRFSCHDVCVVMACAIHQIMQPALFDSFFPFMAQVLNSAFSNKSNQNEKVAQLQHIQFLLELLPRHRRDLVKKLTSHLVSVSERFKIPTKNLVLVSDDSQPMELSMLLMYLIKYHDWMFRVRSPPLGWPHDILDLDFKSVSMVTNISHAVGVVLPPEPMDTSLVQTLSEGSSRTSTAQAPGTSSSNIAFSLEDTPDFHTLVQKFMAITEAPESVARSLLNTCQGNLELAINMHLNMEDTLPVLPDPSAQSSSTDPEDQEMAESTASSQSPAAIDESMLSLLLKIKTSLQSSSSSCIGDGAYYINKLIDQVRNSSPENTAALFCFTPSSNKDVEDEKGSFEECDEARSAAVRRKLARERQQKLLAEFASKQKSFMEQALKKDPDALNDTNMETDAPPDADEIKDPLYECVICGESSPSTEERPVGLVALLQPSAVLKHRSLAKQNVSASGSESLQALNCGALAKVRFNAFTKLFNKDESLDASSAGSEGGIHVQTCGHYLHVDCQQSYLKSLQEEEASQLHQMHSFNPRNGDFTCPLCRKLSNCVLPEIPFHIMPAHGNQRQMNQVECLQLQHETLKKLCQNSLTKLTASALNFSVLGASIKSVVEIASMLDSSGEIPKSERQFSLLYRTVRTNLELEQINREARKLSASRKSCFGSLVRALHFHCQTLVGPLISIWSQLSDIDTPQDQSKMANNKLPTVPLLLRDGPSLLIQMMLSWSTELLLRDFQCLVQLIYNLVFTQALVHSCCKFVGDERLSWQETGKKALVQKKTQKPLTIDMLLGFVTQTLSSSKLFKEDNQMLGISQSVWSPHMVEQSIRDFCLPYLKLTSLISSLCYDTKMPNIEASDKEFQAYATSLQLYTESPTLRDGFSCADCLRWPHDKPLSIIRKWCDSLSSVTRRYDVFARSQDLLPVTHQWQSPKMIELPERYDTLIQYYRKQKCPKCQTKPEDPAVCMVCGRFVCLQSVCCVNREPEGERIHECVQHSKECGAGTGVFLIILSSVIIVIRADRVCVWGSVYLDSFGEEDRDLKRGKPLFLSQDRYNRLQEQWFTHSFEHTCKRWKRHSNLL